ncbi:LPXTG cell wall anchor domain-containing protein [Agromyces laixinhei]|uniref:LPXTG cell wall anchor domain-containing protein n=1 Tax=Agromyces laixinhei TaxID=2585717 RepID=UPI0012EED2D4|nr:LPXTG cell wall anchor domain-containing protein [Agromyces laixinhei]
MSNPGAVPAHFDTDARTRVRWSSRRPFRRIAAILTSLALGAGLAVVGVVAPASAHTGDLIAKAACNPVTGEYDVTYSLKLSQASGKHGVTMWRVGTAAFDGTPKSDAGMDRGPVASDGNVTITLGTESLPGDTTTAPWVYAFTTWSDDFTKGSDGRVENLKGDCTTSGPEEIEVEGAPTFSDECGPGNEQVTLPDNTDFIEWTQAEQGGVITVTATARDGYVFAPGAKTTWNFEVDDAACTEASLDGSVVTGVCEADSPWIFFDVALTDPDDQVTDRNVRLVLSDGTDSETLDLGELDEQGLLEGKVLWPGASVDDEGNADGWPGWTQLDDGTWVETDGNFAWTRDLTNATIVVNPELPVELVYPEATPDCAVAPPTPGEPGGEGETPSTPAAGESLAHTGFAGTTIAIVAGLIVLAGAAFIVIARLRRKKS